jgi:hypothetical protein
MTKPMPQVVRSRWEYLAAVVAAGGFCLTIASPYLDLPWWPPPATVFFAERITMVAIAFVTIFSFRRRYGRR